MHDLSCDEVADRAPSFALDILEPTSRADVAAHLLRCPVCAREVTGMQAAAAELLDVDGRHCAAPDVLPTEAAENRSATGWSEDGWLEARPTGAGWDGDYGDPSGEPVAVGHRRRLRTVAAMTAAALLLVGTALGPELTQWGRTPAVPIASAPLLSGSVQVGNAYFYGGADPVVVIELSGVVATGRLSCAIQRSDGTTVSLGTFKLFSGHVQWAARDRIPVAATASIRIADQTGRTVAAGTLGT